MSDLAHRECVSCRGGVPRLEGEELEALLEQLDPAWEIVNDHHLVREFGFPNFREALAFGNRVGELAERIQHHPDLHVAWGKCKVVVWTHKVDGLTENDFIFAARTEQLE